MDQTNKYSRQEEISLLDYLVVIARRKFLILGLTLGTALLTIIYALMLPNIYRATASILPPQQGNVSLAAQVLGQIGPGLSGLAGSAPGLKNPNDLYIGMLRSRTVYDRVIDRFNLMSVYESKSRENARRILDSNVDAKSGKEGIIYVSIEDREPKRAAAMANVLVEELSKLTQNLALTEAAQKRLFFERQMRTAREAVIEAEEKMQSFQEKTGAIKVDDQAKAVIEGIAKLRAQIAAKEVELKVMKTYATSSNPDFRRTEEEIKGLKAELNKLEGRGGPNPDPFMPTGRVPSISADFFRKTRELKYNETLYELLAKQYEMAKLDEARDAAIIQVLDKAVPPEKKSKPKRAIMVILATIAGFSCAVFAAFLLHHLERSSQDQSQKDRIVLLKRHLRSWKA